ncbi:MAG: excinuclease ABC subunit UvrC [Euryarchaeota archaeon]|nr:excinuclease ABC subunit UvrC [Euryarchaeota archaeon]
MIDLSMVPSNPGCYLFRDTKKNIIYVGKAKNLRKRVGSYFQKQPMDPKTTQLVSCIDVVEYIATDNELEAFILENTLIKKHQPKYNIDLKDAKTYAYILLTDEQFPRLLIARKKTGEGTFFGPFVSGIERDYILDALRTSFMLRTCNKMPKRPCLRYHISLCDAPCVGFVSQSEYNEKIQKIEMILLGKTKELLGKLDAEMKQYAFAEEFEQALHVRKQKEAIEYLHERQNMARPQWYDEDVINFLIHDNSVYLMLFNIYKGMLTNKNEFVFPYQNDFFEEFIVQYYSENPVPADLIVPFRFSDALKVFLSEKKHKKVHVTVPQKGPKKQLLDLVLKNIELAFFGDAVKVEELQKKLNLQESPSVIECFDISHISGTSTVGSMVQFRNGKPDKSNYRRFKIRTVDGVDDVAGVAEVVRRRYTRLRQENTSLPNLIVIDGGRGQLNSALHELQKLGLGIPVISLAKQFEEIYIPGNPLPVRLDRKDKALLFLMEIRDEAHRFAIQYNRLLRKKKLIA